MPIGTISHGPSWSAVSTLPADTHEMACSELRPPNSKARRGRVAPSSGDASSGEASSEHAASPGTSMRATLTGGGRGPQVPRPFLALRGRSLGLRVAAHEAPHDIADGHPLMYRQDHVLGDRHLDRAGPGQPEDGTAGLHTLGNLMLLPGDDLLRAHP